jgi:hypothetical protein
METFNEHSIIEHKENYTSIQINLEAYFLKYVNIVYEGLEAVFEVSLPDSRKHT